MAALVEPALLVLAGPTASGKTALALDLAQRFAGEIVSCDSVAVYRGLEIGAAKPTAAERELVPHHLLDVFRPDEICTAGDYSRRAREAIRGISSRGRLPIVSGGTGLYLRALLHGLFPGPPRHDALRARLRRSVAQRSPGHLHRLLTRLDPAAAAAIHANDAPKLIRAIEITLTGHKPEGSTAYASRTLQWGQPGDPLTGYRILQIGLNPPRPELYARINRRAAEMFERGLVEETALLVERYGYDCRPLTSLGYAQAVQVLRGELSRDAAVAATAQGHRNYAKRQLTWFRRESAMQWLVGIGSEPAILAEATALVDRHIHSD